MFVVSRFSLRFSLSFFTDSESLPLLTEEKAGHIALSGACIFLKSERSVTDRFAIEIAPRAIHPFSAPYAFKMGRA